MYYVSINRNACHKSILTWMLSHVHSKPSSLTFLFQPFENITRMKNKRGGEVCGLNTYSSQLDSTFSFCCGTKREKEWQEQRLGMRVSKVYTFFQSCRLNLAFTELRLDHCLSAFFLKPFPFLTHPLVLSYDQGCRSLMVKKTIVLSLDSVDPHKGNTGIKKVNDHHERTEATQMAFMDHFWLASPFFLLIKTIKWIQWWVVQPTHWRKSWLESLSSHPLSSFRKQVKTWDWNGCPIYFLFFKFNGWNRKESEPGLESTCEIGSKKEMIVIPTLKTLVFRKVSINFIGNESIWMLCDIVKKKKKKKS